MSFLKVFLVLALFIKEVSMELETDTEFLIDPEKPHFEPLKKKVRFSNTVAVYKEFPNPKNQNEPLEFENLMKPTLISLEEMMGHSKLTMRTQMDEPVQCSCAAILLLFSFLFIFALFVWLVIQKLLIIEIESQVQPNTKFDAFD